MSEFAGFPTKTTTFLKNLSRYNSKEWFDANRADYESYWLAPAKEFVIAAGEALQKVAPVEYQPKVNGSIFRVNRDIRFSQDKSPYKDHLDFWFWEGERKAAVSGFYLRVTATKTGIGVGAHRFDEERRGLYRDAVADPATMKPLVAAVKKIEKAGYEVKGEHYKTTPRGYDVEGAMPERFIRYNALWVGEDYRHPPELRSAEMVGWAMAHWRKMAPLHRWLADTLS